METLIINLLLSFMACFASPIDHNHNLVDVKTKELKKLDFSKDSIMSKILEEVTDKVRYGDRPAYYTAIVKKFEKGYILIIERSDQDIFDIRAYPVGYTEVNDRLVIFVNTYDYPLHYTSIPQTVEIKTARLDERPDIKATMYYYIMYDLYAKFSPEAGWIWSDGKPDE